MAKIRTYNPPPSWPAPPPGWTPPPGWQPDPAWGPAPEAWPVWIETRANAAAPLWSLVATSVPLATFLGIGIVVMGSLPGGEAFGLILGRCLFAAVTTAVVAYFRTSRWRFWNYILFVFLMYVAQTVLQAAGSQGGGG